MKKIYIGILALVVLVVGGLIIFDKNTPYLSNNSSVKIIKGKEIPIKIDELDYNVQVMEKDGKIYEYLKAVNNSDVNINSMWVDITDGVNPDVTIEYLAPIKSHGRTDNFDLKNSNDDRVKLPITGKDKKPITNVGDIEITDLNYVVNVKGKPKKITYNFNNETYTMENY